MAERNILTMDPYELKNFLIDLAETYFETNKLDTYEAGFLGYMIQALSHLTSDVLFMNSMAYNEAFTTRATLDTSMVNLASMFAYEYRKPTPATGSLTLRIPIQSTPFTFTIPQYATASANGIPYRVTKKYVVDVQSSSDIQIFSIDKNNVLESVPVIVDTESETYPILIFDIEVRQVDYYTYNFTFPRTYLYKFHREYIKSIEDNVSDVRVFVNGEQYRRVNSIFEAGTLDKVFQYEFSGQTLEIIFGNGVFGHLPDDGDQCKIIIETTKGSGGNVVADAIQLTERIYSNNNKAVVIYSTNKYPIINGTDGESTTEMRGNIIAHISSLDRLVNETDYKRFQRIIPEFNHLIAKNYLLRRDIHQNEINTFVVFFTEDNEPAPMTSYTVETANTEFHKDYVFNIDGNEYVCPFAFSLDPMGKIKHANYEYVVTHLKDQPFLDRSYRGEVLGLNRIEFEYTSYGNISVTAYARCSDSVDPLDVSARIFINGTEYTLSVDGINSTTNNIILKSSDIHVSSLPIGSNQYMFSLYWQNNLHSSYKNNIILRQDLKDIMWSTYLETSTPGSYKIYNIPVILKSYYDTHKYYIDSNLLQTIASYKEKFSEYNMMTDVMNIKFAKTYGKSINMRLNDYNSDAKYTYPSTFSLDIPYTLKINVVVKADHKRTIRTIREEVKNVVYTYLASNMDFHFDIFRSNITRFIHDVIDDVSYAEVQVPDREIVYSFDVEKLPTSERDKLLSFVPEFIWLRKDDIYVTIDVLSM